MSEQEKNINTQCPDCYHDSHEANECPFDSCGESDIVYPKKDLKELYKNPNFFEED